MEPKLALFDFCETLVPFQTADAFVDFVRSARNSSFMNINEFLLQLLRKCRVLAVLHRLFPHASIEKRIKLFQLRGIPRNELEALSGRFYTEQIRPVLISPVLDELHAAWRQGMEVAIVSGGYSIYLRHFTREFNVPVLLAAEIGFGKKDICTGLLAGRDCLYHYKVEKLEARFGIDAGKKRSAIAYSDSITDMPMLRWAAAGVVVSKGREQAWAARQGFRELVWQAAVSTP